MHIVEESLDTDKEKSPYLKNGNFCISQQPSSKHITVDDIKKSIN